MLKCKVNKPFPNPTWFSSWRFIADKKKKKGKKTRKQNLTKTPSLGKCSQMLKTLPSWLVSCLNTPEQASLGSCPPCSQCPAWNDHYTQFMQTSFHMKLQLPWTVSGKERTLPLTCLACSVPVLHAGLNGKHSKLAPSRGQRAAMLL